MRKPGPTILALAGVVGAAAGIGWGYYEVHLWPTQVSIGPWLMSRGRAIVDDRLTVARAAAVAPFMVDPAEVLYIGALRDSDGNLLKSSLAYTVCGRPLDARFWSIAAYDEHLELFPNPAQRFSYNYQNTVLDPNGGFCVHVGPESRAGNWIPTQPGKQLNIQIRLYQPSPALRANLSTAVLPEIHREKGGK